MWFNSEICMDSQANNMAMGMLLSMRSAARRIFLQAALWLIRWSNKTNKISPLAKTAREIKKAPKIMISPMPLTANSKKILVPANNDILAHCFAVVIIINSLLRSLIFLKCFVFQSLGSKKCSELTPSKRCPENAYR